ncbi:MAG: hypothetical protein MJ210_03615 [Alphaproteobacteria bacterium]|nr:hypothetical protein [Alphaproteobacteria bacterium]
MSKKIENVVEHVKDLLSKGQKPVYFVKTARITARPGVPGETIVTKLADGHIETENSNIEEGDMVATNKTGEQYVIKADAFKERYEIDPSNPKFYRPKSGPQMFLRLKEDITFKASWGEQDMRKGDWLNITDMETKGEVRGVAQKEHSETYAPCTPDGKFIPKPSKGRSFNL